MQIQDTIHSSTFVFKKMYSEQERSKGCAKQFFCWFAAIMFILTLWLPLLQTIKPFINEPALGGVVNLTTDRPFSLNELLSGSFAKSLEQQFAQRLGFRNILIKLENQFNYTVFQDIPVMYDSDLILGKSRILHQKEVLRKYIHGYPVNWDQLQKQARHLRQLQDYFNSHGIPMILLIAPTKPHIYPETLPRRSVAYLGHDRRLLYDYALDALDKFGVEYYDGVKAALETKQNDPGFPIIAPNASHWTYAFAAHCLQKALEQLRLRTLFDIPTIDINYERKGEPFWAEQDLSVYGNISFTQYDTDYLVYPSVSVSALSPRKRITLIGDSFAGNIREVMVGHFTNSESALTLDFYYYFNSLTSYPGGLKSQWNRSLFDLETDILERSNLVMIVTSEAALFQFGFGFLETVFPNEY